MSEITTEIWKPIKGYEGLYEVSNLGRVKSVARNMIRKTYIKKDKGYEIIMLCKNGRGKNHSVHRLVAEAFIPNPYGKREINHKDYNRANNNVANLEWVTRVENIIYSLPNRPKENNIGENHSTHFKGVCYQKNINRYQVIIKSKYCGCFKTIEEAVLARDEIIHKNGEISFTRT